MLLHEIIMWPNTENTELCPFALEHTAYLWNHLSRYDSQLTPLDIFSSTKFSSYDHLRRLHVFGLPSYILDPNLQYGKKLPKLSPCYHCGQYLGVSPSYSSKIGRIINPTTVFFRPQYHVVYDDEFTSVPNAPSYDLFADNPFNASSWEKLVRSGLKDHINKEDFNLSNQHQLMNGLNVDCLTPDEGRHPIPSVMVKEGEKPRANQESIPSDGDKSPITGAPGSDSIQKTKEKISASNPIYQQSSDPIDGSDPVRSTCSGQIIKIPEIYMPTMITNQDEIRKQICTTRIVANAGFALMTSTINN